VVTAALYTCLVRHNRTLPVRYGFAHRTYYWLVDLDEPPRLPWLLRPLAAFRSADHVGDLALSIRDNVAAFARENGVDIGAGRVRMLAQPRVFGYVFNPLSVFWCHDETGRLACVVAEVHNTYGGRYRYLLRPDADGGTRTDKRFYVSPFFAVEGAYSMHLPEPGPELRLVITLENDGHRPFTASMTGRRMPATVPNLLRLALRYPLHTLAISARIRWHGIRLYRKGLPVVARADVLEGADR
jgi:DUF1365 family protein